MNSFIERASDVGAGNWNRLVIHNRQRLLERAVIEREGTLQKSLAGKGNQSDASSAATLDEIHNRQLGPLQSRRTHIRCQHAARTVQKEYDILAEQLAHVRRFTPLRGGPRPGQYRPIPKPANHS